MSGRHLKIDVQTELLTIHSNLSFPLLHGKWHQHKPSFSGEKLREF